MHVRVLRWVSSELLLLHKGYECWAKLEIVSLNCRANNGGSDARCLGQGVVTKHPVVLCHGYFCSLLSSRFSASLAGCCFYLWIKGEKGLTPLAPSVYTKTALPRRKQFQAKIKKN